MRSCLYEGRVDHVRLTPREHVFGYRLFLLYLDLAELDEVFERRWLWSTRRPNLAWFRRADHVGDPEKPLDECIRTLVAEQTGRRPEGPVTLLTHLRYFGYCMNPVSFFYCWDAEGEQLESIVAEVHNTPWGEVHPYVLDVTVGEEPPSRAAASSGRASRWQWVFPKVFHVSPFHGMDQSYEWTLSQPEERLEVSMANFEQGRKLFTAALSLERVPLSGRSLARALLRYPFMSFRVIQAIYWQAFRLWWKRCPVYDHPRRAVGSKGGA